MGDRFGVPKSARVVIVCEVLPAWVNVILVGTHVVLECAVALGTRGTHMLTEEICDMFGSLFQQWHGSRFVEIELAMKLRHSEQVLEQTKWRKDNWQVVTHDPNGRYLTSALFGIIILIIVDRVCFPLRLMLSHVIYFVWCCFVSFKLMAWILCFALYRCVMRCAMLIPIAFVICRMGCMYWLVLLSHVIGISSNLWRV